VFETYRILGRQREQELQREADRLHAGSKTSRAELRPRAGRLRSIPAFSIAVLANLRRALARRATAAERPG
jgi:hypothetical protein